jgi:hypothetical protein
MVRNTLMICFALLIDLLQAGISAGLFAIGSFSGTVAGGAAGCLVGTAVADRVGCWVGTFAGGVAGTAANPWLAVATVPLAIGLGFAINFCIDITFGTVLVMWMITQKMYYPRYGVAGYIAELIPGINDLPAWTLTTVLAVIRKSAEEGKLKGSASGTFTSMMSGGIAGAGGALVTRIKQSSMDVARDAGIFTAQQQTQENARQHERIVGSELKNIDGIRAPRNQATEASDSDGPQKLQYAA